MFVDLDRVGHIPIRHTAWILGVDQVLVGNGLYILENLPG